MIKRILPIYYSGWFYLLLLFWGLSFSYISNGGLNQANQLNINLLDYLSSTQELPKSNTILTANDILTLQSSFQESDTGAIKSLLSYYSDSKIILLGQPTKTFTRKLTKYLSSTPRANKVIIATQNSYSGQALKIQSTMMLSSMLNWLRLPQQDEVKKIDSEFILYTPLLLNARQSFPILWQQQGNNYLSLPGELLKQLGDKNELYLNQSWQLKLTDKQANKQAQRFSLGFSGEVFTVGPSYNLNQYSHRNNNTELPSSPTVSHFIEQKRQVVASKSTRSQYKVIIISDKDINESKLIKPLLIKLTQNDYLSQNMLTTLLSWILATIGLVIIWLIRHLALKQQLIALMTFTLVLFIFQYYYFNQHQWLEVLPLLLLIAGSYMLFQGYQKEYSLIFSTLSTPAKHSNNNSPAAVMIKAVKNNVSRTPKQAYKSPQNFSPTAKITNTQVLKPIEDLEQTLVLAEGTTTTQTKISHHLSVDSFGRYKVEGILGKGAMGIVYQGVDPKINRHVAIKTLQLSDDVDSPEFIEAKERFFREAQTAGGLSHANIVTIYDVGEDNNLGYIAMDLLTGAPLSLFTQPGQTLPVPLIFQLLIQITDALDYAHKQNVVHRDIKPANIIYDDDLLKVTVTDFGIAYVSDNSKTRTGIIMGSPYYMSPEQILGLKVDGRSDIFSLGVTFYQLLCGHLPFEGESIATVAYQITKTKPVAVNQRNTSLPASALRITNKAMHKDIEKRYQTMEEFKLALVNALKRDFKIGIS